MYSIMGDKGRAPSLRVPPVDGHQRTIHRVPTKLRRQAQSKRKDKPKCISHTEIITIVDYGSDMGLSAPSYHMADLLR